MEWSCTVLKSLRLAQKEVGWMLSEQDSRRTACDSWKEPVVLMGDAAILGMDESTSVAPYAAGSA